ncbi:AarF/UbiB family protein [Halalkalibacter flavus]|uniref:AarF/UbiB family protein n=1 Tax=Halalkalibacter flavus TaxID=3090668 RepID=UPI002FC8C62C
MNEFQTITVKRSGKSTHINNPTEYKLIGKGRQGAVFKLSENRCVKIYVEEKYCRREKRALISAQDFNIVPKVYEVGSNYIVMEYIEGKSLDDYLQQFNTFPEDIAKQLIRIFTVMEEIGFTRIDAKLRHLLMNKKGEIKVIDHVYSFRKKHRYPIDLFEGLKKLKLFDSFIEQVKKVDQEQLNKWMKKRG